jgi:hypothetical protein
MSALQKLDPQNIPHLLEELEKYFPDSFVVSLSVFNCQLFKILNFLGLLFRPESPQMVRKGCQLEALYSLPKR